MNVSILKIGGSVITDKHKISSVRKDEIDRIVHEIVSFKGDSQDAMILVHGAGSFGHPQAKFFLEKDFDKWAYIVHNSIKELNSIVIESMKDANIKATSVHPFDCCTLENRKIFNFPIDEINLMLEKGVVPVLYGDVVMDRLLGASVLSGDRIVAYLASVIHASKIGAGCNVDGVFDNSGNIIKKISPKNVIDIKLHIQNEDSVIDVTGGMLGKVTEFLNLAKTGINSRIFNASKKEMVSKFLHGDNVGTLIGL